MSIKITIAEIIFLLTIFHYGAAQKNDLKFNLVEGPDGKPPGKIRNMTQDPNGYMWFASEGDECIYRYDGNKITVFKHDNKNPNSLGGIGVNSVYADNAGMIWIGLSTGLDQFNPATGIFKHYRHIPNDPGSIDGNVVPVIKDRQNRLWAGTDKGLYRLDEKSGKFIHYKNEPGNPKSLSSNSVWTIYEDRQGIIWIGTGMPWFNIHPEDGGLNRLEPDGSFTRYMHDPKDPHSLINNKVAAIFEDSKGIFWVGTSKDGLHTLDRKTGLFERHLYNSKAPEQLSRPPLKPGEVNDKITFINEDSTGAVWIGTRNSGINRYDPVTKKITLFKYSHGFPDSTSWNAFVSRDGELWITTENARLYRTDPFHQSISSFPTTHPVRSFLEDQEKNLWVGTHDGGLYRYDQQKNLVRVFRNNPSDTFSLSHNYIHSLFQNQENEICVGTAKGLQFFNKVNQHFSGFNYSRSIKNSAGFGINKIFQDKEGLLWFSLWNGGLVLYNPKDNSLKNFLSNADDPASIGSNGITSILQDRSGNFWFSTLNVGISRLIKGTDSFRHYLPGIDGWFMYEDSEGSIWSGTRKGLYLYNKKDDGFSPFFDSQSEISQEWVNAIIEDDAKNLWVTTSSVIIKLNPARNETFIYDSRFGIINNIQRGAIYKTANGQILVGHEKGFYSFFPNELAVSLPPPKIVVTDLSINNLPVLPGEGNLLQKPIGETDRIVLKYNLNNIAFNFSAIDYRAPETIRYFTMLENYDNTWREAIGEKSSYYFNVSPGDYVYHIKVFNSDGAKKEKTITIRINPPWWTTWLFRIAAIIVLVSISYSLMRWRIKQKFKLQLERLEKERQMAELKQNGIELEMQALRAQMNPHFIFNSLNSINRFILQNNKAQASEYLTKFSKLVRMILQNSQASLITLESELESLELYLNLEALRFNYHFDYKISVPKDVDTSVLKVPPLILQPFVENAIWHGLMHKEEKGQLDIEVMEESDHLCFKIADNGIGREKAATLASKSATKHKSMGLRITAHRIAILHNSQTLTSPVTINDLLDADGNAAGTEVTIKTPIIYD